MIDPQKFFGTEVKEMPRYNETIVQSTGSWASRVRTQPVDYSVLMREIKKCPELVGILNALVTDITSDGFSFEDELGKQPKQKINKALEFMKKTRFKSELKAAMFDWASLGNGALWKGKISDAQLKEVSKKFGISVPEVKVIIGEMDKAGDKSPSTRLCMHVPWSTMNIDLDKDKKKVVGYRQVVNSGDEPITYSSDEIIHGRYMRVDGKVYGYSPTEAALGVITTLTLIKDYHGYHFDNSGIPDWMFILPKEMAGSPNAQKLVETLKKYKSSKEKGGNLVFTGEVEPTQLNRFDKDMEYRELAIYYTGILALAWNMPLARVAPILGTKIRASGADISDAGYWRSISAAQDYWEDLLNSQLFIPEFGVYIKFNRGYKDDEVKEVQALTQKMGVVSQLKSMNIVSDEYIYNFLKIPVEYRASGKIKEAIPQTPFGNNKNLGKNEDLKGGAQKVISDRKKGEQARKPDEINK